MWHSPGARRLLKLTSDLLSGDDIGAVEIGGLEDIATTSLEVTARNKVTWNMTKLFSAGRRLDKLPSPPSSLEESFSGKVVTRFDYEPVLNGKATQEMAFMVAFPNTRNASREFSGGQGEVAWRSDANGYGTGSLTAASFVDVDVEWMFKINGDFVDVFLKHSKIETDKIDPNGVNEIAYAWAVHPECQPDLVFFDGANILQDVKALIEFVSDEKQGLYSRARTLTEASRSLDWNKALMNSFKNEKDYIENLIGRVKEFKTHLQGGWEEEKFKSLDGTIRLENISQMLTKSLNLALDNAGRTGATNTTDTPTTTNATTPAASSTSEHESPTVNIQLCAIDAPGKFELQVQVKVDMKYTINNHFSFENNHGLLKMIGANNSAMTINAENLRSFVQATAVFMRPSVPSKHASFESSVCTGDYLQTSAAQVAIAKLPESGGLWRLVQKSDTTSQGTFGCSAVDGAGGEGVIRFKRTGKTTSDAPFIFELRAGRSFLDSVRMKFALAHIQAGAIAEACSVKFIREDEQLLDEVLAVTKGLQLQMKLGAGRVSFVVQGKCEVILQDIEFFASAVAEGSGRMRSLKEVQVGLTGKFEVSLNERGVGKRIASALVEMDQLGFKLDFSESNFLRNHNSPHSSETRLEATSMTGSLRGECALESTPQIFKDIGISPLPVVRVTFQKLGDAEFEMLYDVDLTPIATTVVDLISGMDKFNIGFPDLVAGTRAATMPIPKVIDFSATLKSLAERVQEYFELFGIDFGANNPTASSMTTNTTTSNAETSNPTTTTFTTTTRTTTTTITTTTAIINNNTSSSSKPAPTGEVNYPTLRGLAVHIASSGLAVGYKDVFSLTGSVQQKDPPTDCAANCPSGLTLQFDLLAKVGVDETFMGGDSIAATCDSIYNKISQYASYFSTVVDVTTLNTSTTKGCGRVTLQANALIGARLELDLKRVFALNRSPTSASSNPTTTDTTPKAAKSSPGAAAGSADGTGSSENEATNAADVIASARLSLHPDSHFDVDIVAKPTVIPAVDADIRLHFQASLGAGSCRVLGGEVWSHGFQAGTASGEMTDDDESCSAACAAQPQAECTAWSRDIATRKCYMNKQAGTIIFKPDPTRHSGLRCDMDDDDDAGMEDKWMTASKMQLGDLLNRTKFLRVLRSLQWDLQGTLDATFKIGASLVPRVAFEPVLTLTSPNLLSNGFGLSAIADVAIVVAGDTGSNGADTSSSGGATKASLFDKVAEEILNNIESVVGDVGGQSLTSRLGIEIPSFFKPLRSSDKLGIKDIASKFMALWKTLATYRNGINDFVKFSLRSELQIKVITALETLIKGVTGVDPTIGDAVEHYVALASQITLYNATPPVFKMMKMS